MDGTLCAVQFVVAHLAQSSHMDAFEGILHFGPQHRQVSNSVELVLLVEEDGVSSSTAWIHLDAMFHCNNRSRFKNKRWNGLSLKLRNLQFKAWQSGKDVELEWRQQLEWKQMRIN
jgi:hypothetical protein